MEQAGELAKNTSILMNVSEFEDVSQATDTLISALQAFKKEGADVGSFSMEIIDKYNEVGNNYAISTSDLAESLTRSSAALVAANNSIEESIAMTAAANTTIQDPESVGNALKTVSMRIRGVKTELEEAGEETDGMITNTSKLQAKIMALTNIDGEGGVNILTESGEFKSTYEILLAISKVWQEMDDIDQAALLELIAGKTRGSVVAALFQNGDVLEQAYDSAVGASGSAMEELSTHLDSIQGRIDIFTNSLQTMWMNFADSEVVKFFVNLGTALIKLVDAIGLIPSATGVFAGYQLVGRELKKIFDGTSVSTKEVTQKLNRYLDTQMGAVDATNQASAASATNTAAKQAEATATNAAAVADAAETKASVTNTTANTAQATASNEVQKEKIEEAAAVNAAAAADATESKTSTANASANAAQAAGSATSKKSNGSTGILGTILGLFGSKAAAGGAAAGGSAAGGALSAIGAALGKVALIIAAVAIVTKVIEGVATWIDKRVHHAEYLKEDVEELQRNYEEAKKSADDNLKTLTTSSDTDVYSTLEDEFARLTRGVDEYGNNISLTSDQYERYKAICEQIVGINPDIAKGYDSATKAIGNNASALSQLIELQKIQMRQNVNKYLEPENLDKIAENIFNTTVKPAQQSKSEIEIGQEAYRYDIGNYIADEIIANPDIRNSYGNTADELIPNILSSMGYTKEQIESIISKYTNEYGLLDAIDFYGDYAYEMYKNKDSFDLENGANIFGDMLDKVNTSFNLDALSPDKINDANKKLQDTRDVLIDTLLQVPFGQEAYDKLNDPSKNVIVDWIKNSEIFKIDPDATGEELQSQLKSNVELIEKLVNDFGNENIQTAIDSFANLDKSSLTAREYSDAANKYINSIWNAIGGKDNEYGFTNKEDIGELLGIDLSDEINKLSDVQNIIAGYLKTNKVDIDASDLVEHFNYKTMTRKEMEALLGIDWNAVGAENVKSVQDVWDLIHNAINQSDITPIKTYSALSESISSYNDILQQTSEIIVDNTEVTQEYKDALVELGISKDELDEYFDKDNPLIVKNAKALNNLVKATNKNIARNAQLAKSQARLRYYELYKKMALLVDANGRVLSGQEDLVLTYYQEMNALEKTIARYSMLEAQLLGTTNAYEKFQQAQEIDSETNYIGSVEEMVLALGEAFNTAELGTETAQAAIMGLVPESIYQDLDTVDEKMAAIYDYFKNGKIAQYFDLEFDDDGAITSVEMKLGNLRKFIEDGLWGDNNSDGINVFEGTDWQHFELNQSWLESLPEGTDVLQALADQMKVTKDVAFAFVKSLKDHDIEWLDGDYATFFEQMLASTNEGKIQLYTQYLADLTAEEAKLTKQLNEKTISQDEYNKKIAEIQKKRQGYTTNLNEAKSASANAILGADGYEVKTSSEINDTEIDNLDNYIDAQEKVNQLQDTANEKLEVLEKAQKDLTEAKAEDSEATEEEIAALEDAYQAAAKEAMDASSELSKAIAKRDQFSEPTEMEIAVLVDDIDSQVEEIQESLDDKLTKEPYTVEVEIDGKKIEKDVTTTEGLLHSCFHIDEDGYWTINPDVNLADLEAKYPGIAQYINLLNSRTQINSFLNGNEAENSANELKNTVDGIISAIEENLITLDLDEEAVNNLVEQANKLLGGIVKSWGVSITANISDKLANIAEKLGISHWFSGSNEAAPENAPSSSATGQGNVNGTAHASGDWGLPTNEHNSLVGELGPELVVDPRTSRYYTVGDNGAEMVDLPKGAIIFNHKQTEGLLKNGHVASRGKAYAEGNAHVTIWPNGSSQDQWDGTGYSSWDDPTYDLNEALDDAAGSVNDFEETIDWIEIRMEELSEALSLYSAQLENQATYLDKNNIIDNMMAVNKDIYANAMAGAKYYEDYAEQYLVGMSDELVLAAKNGAIAITEFTKETDEATVKAIQNYRDYAQKAADLYQQAEESITEIRDLAIQQIDNIQNYGSAKTSIEDAQTEKLQNRVGLDEESGLITADAYYTAMMENSGKKIEYWAPLLDAMQTEFDEAVQNGIIEVGTIEWYEQLEKLYEVQAQIDEATIELEEYQNAINDLQWERFDELINRLDYLKDETQNLIDLMDSDDMVAEPEKRKYKNGTVEYWTADDVEWTDEGIASLGLYAQQMEIAEYKSKQYAQAIDDLTAEYKDGHYSENEYYEKLNELKDAQYENIETYYDAQDAIKDLNETRIDSIRNGIEKEIEAYQELIDTKKSELQAEKDLYDFQKGVQEQQKNIADIQRKIAALSGDNSMSAVAQRKKLQAELAESESELEESYYDRSIENRQNALDKELEDFESEKNAEIEKWDEYLTNVEQVVADSLMTVQENATGVYDTLNAKAQEYDLTLSDAIMTPWQDGMLAVSDYQATFDTAMSSTWDQLEAIGLKWQEVIEKMQEAAGQEVKAQEQENANYAAATKEPEPTPNKPVTNNQTNTNTAKAITVGGKINASGAKIYEYAGDKSGANQYYSKDPIYVVLSEQNGYLKVRHHKSSSGVTGWFKKSDVKALASGTKKLNKSGIVNIDELGEELVLRAQNGRLTYMEKGSGVVPADLTSNLMEWGKLDPTSMLEQNRPSVGVHPEVHNTEVHIDNSIGELIHIDNCSTETLPDVKKIVNEALEKHTQRLNQSLRKFTR